MAKFTKPSKETIAAQSEAVFGAVLPEDVAWKPFAAFPPLVRLAVIAGQPSEPGPYMIRVKVPGGVKLMPHRHPRTTINDRTRGKYVFRQCPVEVEIGNIDPEQTVIPGLAELSRKTGLIVRAVGSGTVERLFCRNRKTIHMNGTKPSSI